MIKILLHLIIIPVALALILYFFEVGDKLSSKLWDRYLTTPQEEFNNKTPAEYQKSSKTGSPFAAMTGSIYAAEKIEDHYHKKYSLLLKLLDNLFWIGGVLYLFIAGIIYLPSFFQQKE